MSWFHSLRFWLLLGAGLTAAVLTFHAWRRRTVSGAVPFAVIMAAVTVWTGSAMMALLSSPGSAQRLWIIIGFVGVVAISPAWLAFTFQYTGRTSWLNRSVLTLLSVIPLITLALVLIPATRGLVINRVWVDGVVHESYGNCVWVFAGFAYLCNLVSVVLMLLKLLHSPPLYRQQTIVILLGGMAPWIANMLHLGGVFPKTTLDPTPLCFALSGLVLAWGLFYHRLLEIMPVARDDVIEHMSDAMLVLDMADRIVDLNPAAQRLFNTTARQTIGRTATATLGHWPDLMARLHEASATQTETTFNLGAEQRDYDLRVSPLFDRHAQLVGRLAVLRDITEDKRAARERERLIVELKAALSDIKLLSGLLPICASCKKIRDDRGYWNQLEAYLQHHSGVQFTHGLCPDCARTLYSEIPEVHPDSAVRQHHENGAHGSS
jgi:PAS domain S-box-containing protein